MNEEKVILGSGKGQRHNEGKIRYDLFEPFAMEQLAKVFTSGAEKYALWNWLQGMKWSKCLASLKRHLAAFEKGEDFDPESKNYHMAHAAWNALALLSYYKHYPQGDDRLHTFKPELRIGLDIDDTIADWVSSWCEKFNLPIPANWAFQYGLSEKFKELSDNTEELNEFFLNLPVKIKPEDMPFEPVCYISHRPVSDEITKQWLIKNGFPAKPVFHVENRTDKLAIAKREKLNMYVDDSYDTFKLMNQNGICCFLMDAVHNRKYEVGFKRIKSLKEIFP